jgi:TetR/AcrR family transcriptional regulator, tetracycline repressor protein
VPGKRAGLTAKAVLDAARRLACDEGIDKLSMRRLAKELGVVPNSLYSHFPSKSALVDALLDSLLAEIESPDPDAVGWREGLTAVMSSARRLVLEHPELASAFLSRQSVGRGALRLAEADLELLRRGGIEGERAVEAHRILLIYSLGFGAFEAARREEPSPDARARHPSDGSYLAGLRWLLDGIEP